MEPNLHFLMILFLKFPLADLSLRSNLAFIEMLNKEAETQQAFWLMFFAVKQIEVLDRISFTQGLTLSYLLWLSSQKKSLDKLIDIRL
jgi:hypothetical protein